MIITKTNNKNIHTNENEQENKRSVARVRRKRGGERGITHTDTDTP